MQREVFSFPTGPKGSPFLPSCIALLATVHIHHLMAAQFRVIGPGQPVVVAMGEDAVLPCHLSPPMSAESMEVRWLQPGFSSYVHLYRGGQGQDGQQMSAYRGRTQLVEDDLTNGSISLRIRSVRPSDHGLYTCFVQSNDSSGDALLELQVTGHYFPWEVAPAVILPIVILLGSFCLWRQCCVTGRTGAPSTALRGAPSTGDGLKLWEKFLSRPDPSSEPGKGPCGFTALELSEQPKPSTGSAKC